MIIYKCRRTCSLSKEYQDKVMVFSSFHLPLSDWSTPVDLCLSLFDSFFCFWVVPIDVCQPDVHNINFAAANAHLIMLHFAGKLRRIWLKFRIRFGREVDFRNYGSKLSRMPGDFLLFWLNLQFFLYLFSDRHQYLGSYIPNWRFLALFNSFDCSVIGFPPINPDFNITIVSITIKSPEEF